MRSSILQIQRAISALEQHPMHLVRTRLAGTKSQSTKSRHSRSSSSWRLQIFPHTSPGKSSTEARWTDNCTWCLASSRLVSRPSSCKVKSSRPTSPQVTTLSTSKPAAKTTSPVNSSSTKLSHHIDANVSHFVSILMLILPHLASCFYC